MNVTSRTWLWRRGALLALVCVRLQATRAEDVREPEAAASPGLPVEVLALKGSPLPPSGGTKLAARPKPGAKKGAEPKKTEAKADDDKPFDDVVKDMEAVKGLFTFYRKADENRYLIELLPEQMDKVFLFSLSVDRSVGERGFYSSQMAGEFPVLFHKVGKNIQWIRKNTTFTAATNTPAARAVARSFPDSILGTLRVKSKPHPQRKSYLLELSDLLLGDLPGLAGALSETYKPTAYRFDKGSSFFGAVKSFPENSLLEATLHYVTDNPKTASLTLPDERSVPLVVKYDFSLLKDTGYRPRLADDRVGHFLTVNQDFTSDRARSPYVRWVHRWQLEKADPQAPLSAPRQPIVFWLENTIPAEYREWFREGVLLWNKAFERVGFKDAIVVKQQPDDADWDPADTRYNTIRWFAGVDASFAIGPSRANPYTGQIYDADIGVSEGIIRSVRRMGEEMIAPVAPGNTEGSSASTWHARRHAATQCDLAEGMAQQAALAVAVLEARGALTPEVEQKLMRQYVVETIAHEVGHTLGLRHNFRASTILRPEELNDTRRTAEVGQTGSVMDYNPIVFAGPGEQQGDFLTSTLGPYDYWAIEYAYKPIEGDEAGPLAKIASRAPEPLLGYATDEDALGTYSPAAIDPLVNQWDQSSDPLAFFRQRIAILRELWAAMEAKLARPGEGYQVLRRAYGRSLNEYSRGALIAAKYIGGVHHYRDHVGDPQGRSPYQPVAAEKQREALEFLRVNVFSDKAFQLPAGLQNKLATERLPTLGGLDDMFNSGARLDYPWHEAVLGIQRQVLGRLFNSMVLARVQDNELRTGAGERAFTMAELFSGLDAAVWAELEASPPLISSLRRNLQREYLKTLIRLTLRTAPTVEDATTLARASLVRLQARLAAALDSRSAIEPTTLAHLQETQARISATLQAHVSRPWE